MTKPATTRLSSKGQVVIPESVRRQLGIEPGAEFVVLGEGDAIVLQLVKPSDMSKFRTLLNKAKSQAQAVGMTPRDVTQAIRDVRGRK